tara:strand:- start:818 stop:1051 length:234 start_codon:yes stop_codon:yes gene_type:complete
VYKIWYFLLRNLKIRKDFLFSLLKEVLIMALNDTFRIFTKKKISLGVDLTSYLSKKDYWAQECKEHLSKKECLFYCN